MPTDRDIELNILNLKEDSFGHGSNWSSSNYTTPREPVYESNRQGRFARFVDSFKRDPRVATPSRAARDRLSFGLGEEPYRDDDGDTDEASHHDNRGIRHFDIKAANLSTASTALARELKGRHLQMIAIGGSIGTGLFVASGKALNQGGPAAVLLAYAFIGGMLYCTVQALGELAVAFPVAGSFSTFSTRFLDPAWGFAMGWNYALQWLVVLPLEIIAASLTTSYWNSHINKAGFVTIFLILIISINLFGVKGYGEAEFVFAIVKVTAVIGFILLGIVINIGGHPGGGYIGGTLWQQPGAFANGFAGLCSVFVTAAFAFAGTELVGLAAAETANPRKSLPTAIKQVFWRITIFYIVALTIVGLLVPYTEPRLLGAKSLVDVTASPFVIAIEDAGIAVLPGIMNGVILIAVMSVGNSAVFGSSRTLAALADQGQAPRILSYVDRRGRPLVAIGTAASFGFLAYLADTPSALDVLNWLLAISALSSIFTWGSICLAHIRFRKAWARRNRSLNDLAYLAQSGVTGSWIGLIANILVLIAQFWAAAWPLGGAGGDNSPRDIASNFFFEYMAVPIVISCYILYKLWYRTSIVRVDDMDVDTGRRDFNLPILVAQEREERVGWPTWKKLYKFLC